MKNMQKYLNRYVIALIIITGFNCSSSADLPVFVSMIGAKTWTNTADTTNTFFFFDIPDNTSKYSFNGNENLSGGGQASFTGEADNHSIQFTYDASTNASRAGKTYKGTVNDASDEITLKGTDATAPLPAVTLNAQ